MKMDRSADRQWENGIRWKKNKTKSGTDKRKNVKEEANKKQKQRRQHKVECLEHKKEIN